MKNKRKGMRMSRIGDIGEQAKRGRMEDNVEEETRKENRETT